MDQNHLFEQMRWRLAGWYAGVMGSILMLSGVGVYQVVAHAYQESINQGLVSVASALKDSIEPLLQHPQQLQPLAHQLSLRFCRAQMCNQSPTSSRLSIAATVDTVNYYLRLSDREGHPIALAGIPLTQLPMASARERQQTLATQAGVQYRQITLPLMVQQQPWGYLQVGRSITDMQQHLAALRLTLLVGCPLAMVLVGGASLWLAGLGMQPVYRSYQQMRQFTADAAHELRTPLAAMQSTIESALMQQEHAGSSVALEPDATLTILKRQNIRLSQLIRDLLLLARIDQQALPGERSLCCLTDLIHDLIEEMASLAIAAQVTLSAKVVAAEPVAVMGIEDQLYRVISNLLDNAIQATPPEGNVVVTLAQTDTEALIQVQDTGVGIAPEEHQRIFDRFYRVQPDRSRHTGGSGLGLPIAQAIVLAHNGRIHVQSQLGQGSTFTVQLPLAGPAAAACAPNS